MVPSISALPVTDRADRRLRTVVELHDGGNEDAVDGKPALHDLGADDQLRGNCARGRCWPVDVDGGAGANTVPAEPSAR